MRSAHLNRNTVVDRLDADTEQDYLQSYDLNNDETSSLAKTSEISNSQSRIQSSLYE